MFIKLSKLFYILLVFYYGWFQIIVFQLPGIMLILGLGMSVLVVFDCIISKENILHFFTIEFDLWLLFALTSFIFGIFIAINFDHLLYLLSRFFQFLLMIFCMLYISKKEKKVDFFVKVFVAFSLVCAITAVFYGESYGGGRISLGSNNNPNQLGILMVFGTCFILWLLNISKIFYTILSFCIIVLNINIIILTGSKKSLIAVIILLVFWILFVIKKELSHIKLSYKIIGLALILLTFWLGYIILLKSFENSVMAIRLNSFIEQGDPAREKMYQQAFNLFKENPIIGVGFNNYRDYYGSYTHSTYAEAIACTGLIGSILYLSPFIILFFRYILMEFSIKTDYTLLKKTRIMLCLLLILIFLGLSIIHFYEIISNIAFGILICFFYINNPNNPKKLTNNNNK